MLEPEFGLLRQSYAPRRQRRGLMNADGWGVGFYADGESTPRRWRSARPLWSDASFASIAPALSSGSALCAVRSATEGMPLDESAAAPFTDGTCLLSHNGRVDRRVLPPNNFAESVCDSAVLAAHLFSAGPDLLADTIMDVARLDPTATLNVVMIDGQQIRAITWGDTLSYLLEPDGVVVASEPWDDDPRWVDVPDRHLVKVDSQGVTVTDLATFQQTEMSAE